MNEAQKITRAELREVRRMTMREFVDALQRYGHMTRREVDAEIERPDATMFDVIFASTLRAAANGDKDARSLVMDRLWGKPRDVQAVDDSIHDDELNKIPRAKILQLLREHK